ncbi:hypothetical protein AB3K25_04275 [Leuconostoc sp. MS02]|uniref:Uncharacterized protein n=1 Tax=Leuconostoc aquikimchii TaxID=3236804 RepID=A0ABV3S356_9LACO
MLKYIRELSIWILSWIVGKFFKLSSVDALSLATVITAVVYLAFMVAQYINNLESWQNSVNQHINSQGDKITPTARTQLNNTNSNNSNINISVAPSVFTGNKTVTPDDETSIDPKVKDNAYTGNHPNKIEKETNND